MCFIITDYKCCECLYFFNAFYFPLSTFKHCVNFRLTTLHVLAGDLSKFGRGDASSPAPATTLAQTQQNQTQTHHTTQQPFLNPALPPGYSYTSLPYYTGMPGLPNTFQYAPAVFPVRIDNKLINVLASITIPLPASTEFFFCLFVLM